MKDVFLQEKLKANDLLMEAKFIHLTNTLRSLLQTAAISILEITKKETSTDLLDLNGIVERFKKPADGMPVEIFDKLAAHLRAHIDKRFMYGWYEKTRKLNSCLSHTVQLWVEFRNKKGGHGVLDIASMTEWTSKISDIIDDFLDVFSEVIPKVEDNSLYVCVPSGRVLIDFPLLYDGMAIVVTEVTQRKGNWRLKFQPLNYSVSEPKITNLPDNNIFNGIDEVDAENYKIIEIETGGKEYIVEHNIPIRQTDTFEGRDKEKDLLVEWLNDEDSRRCLIYGDGGYGKTTLVLEVLNLLLEGEIVIPKNFPSLICFYTAKMTRWTDNGLVRFSSIQPLMDECIRELMKCFIPTLDKQWYTITGTALIDKAVGILRDKSISRDDVLLIIDNSETLSDSPQGHVELAEFFKAIGKKLGRLIITSRRHEGIEASQIMVEGLNDEDSVSLLSRLAVEYGTTPILQAGERKLKSTAKKLMNKPLLLEALVVYISRSNISIENAMDNLYRKSNDDLLEFLYEDAWARLSDIQKDIFYIIVSITSPLNSISIGMACQLIETQHIDFQESLRETHFASILDYGNHYELELVELARRFFEKKLSESDQDKKRNINELAREVEKYTSERNRIEKEYKEDRVFEAFRNEYSKVAKVAVDNKDYQKAVEYYQLAITDDPLNSALHDRFAWFLSNKMDDIPQALKYAIRAIELNPRNCDAIVNLALIYYRNDNIIEGDKFIEQSELLGRPLSFCLLRKAIARYHYSFKVENSGDKRKLLDYAYSTLNAAEKNYNAKIAYAQKIKQDIAKFKQLTLRRISIISHK